MLYVHEEKWGSWMTITLMSSYDPLVADKPTSFLQAEVRSGFLVPMQKGRTMSIASWLLTWKDTSM